MLKKHTFSPNHKVVETKHDTSAGGSAGPGNHDAQGSGPAGMSGNPDGGYEQAPGFCEGGKMADGGDTDSLLERAGSKVADFAEAVTGAHKGGATERTPMPLSAGDSSQPAMGPGGSERENAINKQVKEAGG